MQDAIMTTRDDLSVVSRDELMDMVIDLRAGRVEGFEMSKFEYVINEIMSGRSARSVFRREKDGDDIAPCRATFYKWLSSYELNKTFGLQAMHNFALIVRAWDEFEYMFEIADDGRNDWMEEFDDKGENTGWKLNGEHVQRSRLRIDLRKWAIARMNNARFGDKFLQKIVDSDSGGGLKVIEYYMDAPTENGLVVVDG